MGIRHKILKARKQWPALDVLINRVKFNFRK
jgi:hypothetical protein